MSDLSALDQFKLINKDSLLDIFEGAVEMIPMSAKIYLETYPDPVGFITEYLHSNDLGIINERSHSLKGVTKQFAAKKVFEIFAELELKAKNKESIDADKYITQLTPLLIELTEEIKLLSTLDFSSLA